MILDATAGKRMMWFDKHREDVIYLDQKKEVHPTINCVWEYLPFPDETFELVVFDPPYDVANKITSHVMMDYGALKPERFYKTLADAFLELFRVLKTGCFLIFKWGEVHKPLASVLATTYHKPLFGQKTNAGEWKGQKTYWVCFRK